MNNLHFVLNFDDDEEEEEDLSSSISHPSSVIISITITITIIIIITIITTIITITNYINVIITTNTITSITIADGFDFTIDVITKKHQWEMYYFPNHQGILYCLTAREINILPSSIFKEVNSD